MNGAWRVAPVFKLPRLAYIVRIGGDQRMATMISEVYDAFIAAGAPEEKARKAAEALASYENRFSKIEADLLLLKWMTGAIAAGVTTLVLRAFFPS